MKFNGQEMIEVSTSTPAAIGRGTRNGTCREMKRALSEYFRKRECRDVKKKNDQPNRIY